MNKTIWVAVGILALTGAVAGCGNKDSQTADNTPAPAASTPGAAEQAGKAIDESAKDVKDGTKAAVDTTKDAAKDAGAAVAQGAQNAGEAVKGAGKTVAQGAENAGEAVKGATAEAGEAVGGAAKDAAAVTTLTPKVKNALVVSKQIDASTLNVDTNATAKTVTIKGTQPTAAKQKLVTQIAQKALADAKSPFKVKNEVTVAK